MTFTNDGVVVAFISDERAPTVSLAGVLPSICSTDHVGGDLSWSVDIGGCAALDIGHCVDINLEKSVGKNYRQDQKTITGRGSLRRHSGRASTRTNKNKRKR